jgi:hypothetical protein
LPQSNTTSSEEDANGFDEVDRKPTIEEHFYIDLQGKQDANSPAIVACASSSIFIAISDSAIFALTFVSKNIGESPLIWICGEINGIRGSSADQGFL